MRRRCATALFAPGDHVEILQSDITGTVVEVHMSRHCNRYTVSYVDNNGNPQMRKWLESQLDPVGSDTECTAHAMALGEDFDLSNVIRYPARYAGAA